MYMYSQWEFKFRVNLLSLIEQMYHLHRSLQDLDPSYIIDTSRYPVDHQYIIRNMTERLYDLRVKELANLYECKVLGL